MQRLGFGKHANKILRQEESRFTTSWLSLFINFSPLSPTKKTRNASISGICPFDAYMAGERLYSAKTNTRQLKKKGRHARTRPTETWTRTNSFRTSKRLYCVLKFELSNQKCCTKIKKMVRFERFFTSDIIFATLSELVR